MQTQSPLNLYVSGCNGGDSCCTTANQCDIDEGDCDVDGDCKAGLLCGTDNCPIKTGFQWDATDDCCYKPRKTLILISMCTSKAIQVPRVFEIGYQKYLS